MESGGGLDYERCRSEFLGKPSLSTRLEPDLNIPPGSPAECQWLEQPKELVMNFSLLVLLLLIPACAFSQAITATLLGTVTDASGAVVPNANITVTEVATAVSRKAICNQEGI